ncbi:MAG: hypothetical protein JWQ96_390 [Segetibacter sp.]|nr:hypothetical protein [Segetibacter sp.]
MAKIKIGLSPLSDAEVLVSAHIIIRSMTGNVNFANPVPPLADVQAAIDALEAALSNMPAMGKEGTIIKNKCRVNLDALLMDLGLFVQLHSKGNEEKLVSSGFELSSKRAAVGVLAKPQNFRVRPGNGPGSVKLSQDVIDGASTYLYEFVKAPVTNESVWTPLVLKQASIIINGLESGGEYHFRTVGIGTNPTRIYSDEISSYVL